MGRSETVTAERQHQQHVEFMEARERAVARKKHGESALQEVNSRSKKVEEDLARDLERRLEAEFARCKREEESKLDEGKKRCEAARIASEKMETVVASEQKRQAAVKIELLDTRARLSSIVNKLRQDVQEAISERSTCQASIQKTDLELESLRKSLGRT